MTETEAETKKSQGGWERKDRTKNGEDGAVIAIHPYFKYTRSPSMKWLSVFVADLRLRVERNEVSVSPEEAAVIAERRCNMDVLSCKAGYKGVPQFAYAS